MSIMRTVLRSPHFKVISHVCKQPRVDCGVIAGDEPAHLIFTRCGSFLVHVGSKVWCARPGQAILMRKNVEYHASHPVADSCDLCTDVLIDDDVLDMLGKTVATNQPCQVFRHDLQFQMTHVEMFRGFLQGEDAEDADEVLLDTLAYLMHGPTADDADLHDPRIAHQVARVEEAIIGHAGENVGVDELAKLAGCSPFHLCRIFRRSTGQSLRQFRLQQRLGTALGRLGGGEKDLAALACDMGFNSHSHMTDAFRQVLGMSPRAVREDMQQSNLQVVKRRLKTQMSRERGAGLN